MDISRLNAPYQITEIDPWLAPYAGDIELRMDRFREKRYQLVGDSASLESFANGYMYFGFHRTETGWVFREWMPEVSVGCPSAPRKVRITVTPSSSFTSRYPAYPLVQFAGIPSVSQ